MNFDIIVVTNHHREALILEYLKDIPHKKSYTPDYELPEKFKPDVVGFVQEHCHTGAYRCFRGHQDAIKLCEHDNALILEDDAVPNTPDWLDIVKESVECLDEFELVSLHGRGFNRQSFVECKKIRPGNNMLTMRTKGGAPFICGSLAYMLNRKMFSRILDHRYNGLPMDLFLYSKFDFCLLEKSPFDHDRRYGSLVD